MWLTLVWWEGESGKWRLILECSFPPLPMVGKVTGSLGGKNRCRNGRKGRVGAVCMCIVEREGVDGWKGNCIGVEVGVLERK